jgi:hypothetical protein
VSRLAVAALGLSVPGLLYLLTRPVRIADWERFEGPSHWWMDPVLALALGCSPIAVVLGIAVVVLGWRRREAFRSTLIALLSIVLSLAALSFMALENFDRGHERWGSPLPPGYVQKRYWWWGPAYGHDQWRPTSTPGLAWRTSLMRASPQTSPAIVARARVPLRLHETRVELAT